MIMDKISLILAIITVILLDFVQDVLKMQTKLGIILHRDVDRHELGYASATMTIDRYMRHVYLCMVHSMCTGRTGYLERVHKLENHRGKDFTFGRLLDHLYTYGVVYVVVGFWIFVITLILAVL